MALVFQASRSAGFPDRPDRTVGSLVTDIKDCMQQHEREGCILAPRDGMAELMAVEWSTRKQKGLTGTRVRTNLQRPQRAHSLQVLPQPGDPVLRTQGCGWWQQQQQPWIMSALFQANTSIFEADIRYWRVRAPRCAIPRLTKERADVAPPLSFRIKN